MTLKEDVNAGLAHVSAAGAPKLALDANGACQIPVPVPGTVIDLVDHRLLVRVELAPTESLFSLSTPLAVIRGKPDSEFWQALLHRQRYADQSAGASLAVQVMGADEKHDVLLVIYHWLLDSISSDQFAAVFKQFTLAAILWVEEISEMARRDKAVKPVHRGRR